jgi:AAA domain (Cdc48 subfamily)
VAQWLARGFHELHRRRHLVLYGNIDDLVRWDDRYLPLRDALNEFLALVGFRAVAHYDLVDGLSYADDASRDAYQRFASGPAVAAPPGPPAVAAAGTARRERLAASTTDLRQRVAAAQPGDVRTPDDLFGFVRPAMAQQEAACALVVHSPDLIVGAELPMDDSYRAHLASVRRLTAESALACTSDGRPLRNTLVLVARDLAGLPPSLHRDTPHVACVPIPGPGAAERAAYFRSRLGHFAGGDAVPADRAGPLTDLLANLTDGLTIVEMSALEATSRTTGISITTPRRLVLRHRFGLQNDPWEQLDLTKIARAETLLAKRVVGQPAAVRAVADVLVNARVGLDFVDDAEAASQRPKGVFFFVGPTGVGKTELAKAIAEFVFDDEAALGRFDMSEFGQEHTSERLTGAPPGYVGHEQGGVLTNWAMEHPFSVILFDEFEKAHRKTFDKFLQIIDDGRLTDGQGRTVYFSQSVIIFTSNLGGTELREALTQFRPDAPPAYGFIEKHFRGAVDDFFTGPEMRRPELLGRLGNGIVVFDIMRRPVIALIVAKFLDQLRATATRRGYQLVFDRPAIERCVADAIMTGGAALGARQIRSPLLEQWVRIPLNRWIVANTPAAGSRIWVHRNPAGPPFLVSLFPGERDQPE